jgi:23S rRNA pseudouridine2605 synthase
VTEHGERLQKVLARAGFGSRRACEELIRSGRVRVNRKRPELGIRVSPDDEVKVDGIRISLEPDLVYLALHKPAGYVSTVRDPAGRPTVLDLVPRTPRVFPVGRLDLDTSGLLFLTNDGDFANHVAHPRYEVPKTYVAEVRGSADHNAITRLTRGVDLEDGPARAESAVARASNAGKTMIEVVVREGRNRLVRRMLDAVGFDVTALVRTSIGPVRLGRLKEATWRTLKRNEIQELLGAEQTLD